MKEVAEINGTAACPYCGAGAGGGHFCSGCERIQPVARGVDYFAFLGLPRKLMVDGPELEKTFYSLSRRFHPDYFMNASDRERRASMERSSLLNDAYRTLRDPVRRAEYLLALEGYKEAEKKAPPDLLEEVFELNMQVEELKAAKKMADEDGIEEARGALEEALSGLNEKMGGLDARLSGLFDAWDEAVDTGAGGDERKKVLDRMSELLSHRSYVRALVRDIKEEI
ncbi:MAG TPA: Fe-S protein assembly co-chaperone HscB [Blastocatellia bacterium]|nr:Fe-S protein assembly co-chaperone HscB [Blastocatellia bacterium]